MATQDMYDKISLSIDNCEVSIGIFIDLAKAFDTVNHKILFRKLEHYGIRGVALHWIKDYLSRRKQYVYYNNVSSSLKDILCGVPQGSILGPLLFILYANDIGNCSSLFHFILFADDTNIFFSSKSVTNFEDIVNSELLRLSEWFRANKLSLNINKTHFILFGNKSKACLENLCIKIEGRAIEKVSNTKFLGVYIDEDLNWKQHTYQISLKISKSIGVLHRIKSILSRDLLKILYYTMIHPYYLYCNIIWGGASQAALSTLICLQKRAVRLISKSEFRAHTGPIFSRLGILKLNDIHKFQVLIYMYKAKFDLLPGSIPKQVTPLTVSGYYNLRKDRDFLMERFRTDIRKKSIAVNGPDLWHSLSAVEKEVKSIFIFKKLLIRSFIDLY
jgi:hypothetical protein